MFPYFHEITPYYGTCRRLLEVGVGDVWSSNLWPWIQNGNFDTATMIEANPRLATEAKNSFLSHPKIHIYNNAIGPFSGQRIEFSDFGQGSHANGIDAPRLHDEKTRNAPHGTFAADTITLDQIDDGAFDFVSIDVEGMEAVVVEQMVSRPLVLIIETHFYQSGYVTPGIEQIFMRVLGWGYKIQSIRGAETVFIKA